MKKNVFALAKNHTQAQKILSHLNEEGFSNENISFLAQDRENRFTRRNARGELEVNPDVFENNLETRAGSREVQRKGFVGHERHTKAPEGAATGAVAGGVIGGSLGLLAGLGALAIPGLGPFIAAGPILAALSGSGIGGSLGLIVGGLVGLGFPEFEAKKIERGLNEGRILINVEVQDANDLAKAEEILRQEGATDISTVNVK